MKKVKQQNLFSSALIKSIQFIVFYVLTFSIASNSNAEKLKLTTVDWQPFFGHDLPEKGFFSAIAREAFKRAGYEIDIEFQPWKRALESTKKGKYDGLLGAYYNEERTKFLNYSDVVFENKDVFISTDQTLKTYQNLEDLKKYRIGTLRGTAYSDELKEQGFIITETDHDTQSIRMLLKDRLDLILMSQTHFQYLLEHNESFQEKKDEMMLLNKPFRTYSLYCPLSKQLENSEEIINRFNSALDEMRKDGTFKEIINRFGFSS